MNPRNRIHDYNSEDVNNRCIITESRMPILSAAVLGIVQGLTEFLPVSSSAHLILVPWLFGWEAYGLAFDVSLHVGTAIAVLAFFRAEWVHLAREVILGFREADPFGNRHRKLAWYLVVGTIPAVVVGFTMERMIDENLRSPLVIVFTLATLAALLLYAETKGRKSRTLESLTWTDSILIGLSQAIALIPGVSRSGITMTTALLRNCNRVSAARFSFLLSTPVIVGAGILQSWRYLEAVRNPSAGTTVVSWTVLGAGTLCAAITGFLCIRYFLRYLQAGSFVPFVLYRFVLAGLILAYYLKAH